MDTPSAGGGGGSGGSNEGCLAVCWSDGAEVHWLEDNLTAAQNDEFKMLKSVLDDFCKVAFFTSSSFHK